MEDTDSVKLSSVVNELIKSAHFVSNWKRFDRALETNHPNFVSLERQYNNGTLTIYELLMETLACWVSKDSSNATIKKLISVLESENFNDVAGKLKVFPIESRISNTSNTTVLSKISPSIQQSSQLETEIDVPHWFEVRQQAPKFTGRADELTKLDKFCTNNDKLILVAGMGGIGKSQLVSYFAEQFYKDKNGSVIWLQGQNENSFIESIERLTGWKKPKKYSHVDICAWIFTAFKAVHAKLKTNPTLIIIDNVDQRNFLVEFCIQKTKSLPPTNLPIVLVTSRKKDILGEVVSCILNLEGFDPYTAVKFVLDSLEGESDNTAVDVLCKRLQYFPLALRQAVAYIQMKRQISIEVKFTISDYLVIIERQKIELLGHKLNEIESDYKFTILTTWNVTLESIKFQGEVGIAAANILQLLAYTRLQGISMNDLKEMYEDTFVPHNENAEKRVNDAIELLRSYSMCNIQIINTSLKVVSMHCLLQEVIRLQNLMQNNTTFFKSVITTRNMYTWADSLPNVWYDCLKSDSFVRENVEMLYDCCVEIFSETFRVYLKKGNSEMIEECNKAIIRVLGNESQELFFNSKCIPLLKESNKDKYASAAIIYLDIKDVLDKDQIIAKRFACILNGIMGGPILQKFNNDKQIPITGCINFYKFSVLNVKEKIDCLELTKWVINVLCLELNTEKLHEIQYFLCDLYYKNELEKRTLLTFLKCIEFGIQVIKGDNICYDECTSDYKEAVEGICSYSKQIKHQCLVENTRLFFQEDESILYNLLKSRNPVKIKSTFYFLQNLEQVFMDDYSKEVYDPEKMERSVDIVSENLRTNKVCHIKACFVAHIMLAVDNLFGKQLSPAATAILLEITNKQYRLLEKFFRVVKYDMYAYWKTEVVSKIDYVRRLPIVQHSTEPSVLIDTTKKLLGKTKDSKGLMLNSVNFDKDFNIKNIESSTKQKIDYDSYFGSISKWYESDEDESDINYSLYLDDIRIKDKSDNKIDLNDVLTIENGLFVWKRKQREESNCKIVYDKMKDAVLQDFELAVIAALKTVKQSTDGNFRYETFWCAARLVYFKLETFYEASDKVLDFLDECLSLTETDTERCIFQSKIILCIFSYVLLEAGHPEIRAFLIYLRHSELNIVLLNKVLECTSEELSKLQLKVFKLIEQNLIRIPQNGYQVIKLITLKLIKQGNFRFSLSEFRMAASFNLNDKNLAQVIQNENKKLFFIQTINKKLSLSNWNESEIPVDLSIALFYHMLLEYDSMQEEALLLLEKILIFLEENNEFSEMVNIGRNTKKILAFAKSNQEIDPNFVISKITYILDKAGKKYMIMRLQKPIRTKNETEDIVT